MKEKLELYFEKEYQATLKTLKANPTWIHAQQDKKDMICYTIQRCLGAVMFAQEVGLAYEDTKVYDDYLEKFRTLIL